MIYATLKTLHVLSIIVWVGGMVFAHFFLRPAIARLEPPVRLRLMHEVLGRFFKAVLVGLRLGSSGDSCGPQRCKSDGVPVSRAAGAMRHDASRDPVAALRHPF